MWLFALSLFIVSALSFGQLNFLNLNGVQPNLALSFLVAYALVEKDWLKRSAVVLLAALILNFQPSLGLYTVFLTLSLFVAVALVDSLRWQPLINAALSIALITLLINLDALRIGVVLSEVIYNIAAAGLLLAVMAALKRRFGE